MKKSRGKKYRIFAVFLCFCVLFTMPGIQNVFPVVAAGKDENFQKENIIMTFDPLSEDIKEQTVFVGTDLDELDLPKELTVSLLKDSSEQKEGVGGQENTEETDNIDENSDTETKDEQDTQPEASEVLRETDNSTLADNENAADTEDNESSNKGSIPSEEQEESESAQETYTVTMPENHAENVIPVQTLEDTSSEKQEDTVTISGVTWQSEPEYDGYTEGIYTFTAILPDGYTLAEGVSLPQITVTVKESESDTGFAIQTLLDRIAALPDAEEYLASEPDMEDEDAYAEWEEKLYEYAEEALVIWEEYEALTEEQQTQMPEEELAKLTAWVELAETLSDNAVMLVDNSGHHGGAEWRALTTTSSTTLSTGYYYLVADENANPENTIKMNTITIEDGATVTLCLNGCTLEHSGGTGSVIVVGNGATFTLCDCKEEYSYDKSNDSDGNPVYTFENSGGCITGGNSEHGGGVYISQNATFNMESGVIRGNKVGNSEGNSGGGVYLDSNKASFNMSGGVIAENSGYQASVYIGGSDSRFNMSGNALIIRNTASVNTAVWCDSGGIFEMLGGEILGNISEVGCSGIYVFGGTFYMKGGLIEGNISCSGGSTGAAVLLGTDSKADLSGGKIINNINHTTSKIVSGGIKIAGTSVQLMLSGDIEVNGNYCYADETRTERNIFVFRNSRIKITGPLSNHIGIISQAKPAIGSPVIVANGDGYDIQPEDWYCITSDEEYKVTYKDTGENSGNQILLEKLGDCDLSGLTLTAEGAELELNFQADITTYEATVGSDVEKVGITATTASEANITIKVNDGAVADMQNGKPKTVDLIEGKNTITITVTSDGMSKTYTIEITREAPAGNPVTITTNKDGVVWTGEGAPSATDYKLTSDGGSTFLPSLVAPDGTYKIYIGKTIDTGVEVTVAGAETTAIVDYYTVTFYDGNTGLPTPTQQIVLKGATASAPTDNPTKTGYTFSKWVTTDGGSTAYGFNEAVTKKTSVYASWSANTYTVSYDGNGSTGGSTANSTHAYGTAKALTANGFTRSCTVTFNLNYTGSSSTDKIAAYTFAGWNTKADGSGTSYDDKASVENLTETNNGTVTLYAQWTPTSVTYTPTRAGYTFAGWYAEASCTSSRADSDGTYTPTGDMTLYAKWTPESYHVFLNTNEGTGGTDITSYTCGTVTTLTTDWTKTGYTFAGWYNNENCTGDPVTEISATDTGDKTFWAKWTPQTYQVTFHYHGADGGDTTTSQNVTYDSKYGILPVPTRTGYTFKGWYIEENGQGSKVTADTIVKTADAHTFHAYWKDETAPDQPVLQDGVTLPSGWTNAQDTIPLKLYDGVGVTELWVSVDGKDYIKVDGFSGGTGSVNYEYTVQSGEHTYQFMAKDAVGNTSVASDKFEVKLDQTKPVIGTLTYDNAVHLNFWHWIIGKESIVIHVPVTDTDSSVTKISYTRTNKDAAGNLDTSSAVTDTATVTNGEAKITIAADFRGTIAISCTDAAGNAADGVTIGKDAGGMIVEDNAPDITILADRNLSDTQQTQPSGVNVSEEYYNSAPALIVTVKDDTGNAITAGIATVTYQVGDEAEKSVTVNGSALQAEVSFTIPATEIAAGSTQIKVIIKATDNAGNTADRDITINVKGPEKQPAAVIDYRQEELTGLVPGGSYTIDGTETTADQEGHIAIKENWLGGSISIVKNGNGSETSDSPAQILFIPTIPPKPAPSGVDVSTAGGTGKLTGLTAGTVYEISTDGGKTWISSETANGSGEITGLAPGTYVVRVKAGVSNFASEKSEPATIGAYKVTVTFMVDGAVYKEIPVDYGTALTDIPSVPDKDGKAGEWCVDEQGGSLARFTNITADMTVYAVYTTAYTVILQGGEGYTLSAVNGSKSPVKEGGSFTFRFELKAGYERGSNFVVKVSGVPVELVANDTYTITDIRENQTVTVEGVVKSDGGSSNQPDGGDNDDDNGGSEPTPTPTPEPTQPPTSTPPTTPTTPPGTTPPVTENEPEGRKPEATPEPGETPGSEKTEETPGSEETGNNEMQPPAETSQPQIPDTTPGSLTYSVGKGAVIVTLNNVDETVCAARVADASAVAQAVLSEEELAEVKQGQIIEIRIDVERLDIVPENDAEVIEKGIEDCQEQIPGLVMGMYVDISMYMRIGSGDWNAIHATNKPVEIILDVPGELAELTADFYIIRAHEGEYLLMEDLDETRETITIQTEAFSTYAILYQMQEDAGEKPAAKCSLCHICPTFLGICYFIWLAIIIALILVIWIVIRRKYNEKEEQDK